MIEFSKRTSSEVGRNYYGLSKYELSMVGPEMIFHSTLNEKNFF
jgi:hypothetical protein